jgi:hypothetical protein
MESKNDFISRARCVLAAFDHRQSMSETFVQFSIPASVAYFVFLVFKI